MLVTASVSISCASVYTWPVQLYGMSVRQTKKSMLLCGIRRAGGGDEHDCC